jgi:hypothetical protein
VAILLLGAAAIAFILSTGSGGSRLDAPAPERAQPPAAPPVAAPLPPLPSTPDAPVARAEPGPRVEPGLPPLPPELDRWEAVPVATRTERMGLIGPILASEVSALQPRLAACLDEDRQVRPAQAPPSQSAPEPGSPDEPAPTLLVLNLELEAGRIRIEDATVELQGRASDAAVACAQQILRGHVIPAPVVTAPGRARMALPLAR